MPSVVGLLGSGSDTEGSRGVLGKVVAGFGCKGERKPRGEREERRREEEGEGSAGLGWARLARLARRRQGVAAGEGVGGARVREEGRGSR